MDELRRHFLVVVYGDAYRLEHKHHVCHNKQTNTFYKILLSLRGRPNGAVICERADVPTEVSGLNRVCDEAFKCNKSADFGDASVCVADAARIPRA
jgi:hypothetical protein